MRIERLGFAVVAEVEHARLADGGDGRFDLRSNLHLCRHYGWAGRGLRNVHDAGLRQEAEQARQVAQGQADAVVIRAKADAESRLISAEAEAKSLELIAKALKDRPELLNYQYINRLAPNTQVMLLPSNAPVLFNLPGMQNIPTPTATPSPTPAPTPKP